MPEFIWEYLCSRRRRFDTFGRAGSNELSCLSNPSDDFQSRLSIIAKDIYSLSGVLAVGDGGLIFRLLHNRVLQKVNGCLLNGADLQQDIP